MAADKENSPSGLWRQLGKLVGCKPSWVRIPYSPQKVKDPRLSSGVFLGFRPRNSPKPRSAEILLRSSGRNRYLGLPEISNRASALDNQNAFWSKHLWFQPSQTFLGTSFVSFPHSCFLHFLRNGFSEAKIININRLPKQHTVVNRKDPQLSSGVFLVFLE